MICSIVVQWNDQRRGKEDDPRLLLIISRRELTATNQMLGVMVSPVVIILLFPPLKKNRPLSDGERSIEWSQFIVFAAVWGLLLSLGLAGWEPIAVAGVLFAGALVYAIMAGNASFALASLLVAVVGISVYTHLPVRAAFFPPINEGEPATWRAL